MFLASFCFHDCYCPLLSPCDLVHKMATFVGGAQNAIDSKIKLSGNILVEE